MIRKLRRRLVLASMLSLLMVLAVILGGVNVLNYRGIAADADSVLEMLQQSGGQFPVLPADVNWRDAGPRFQSPELMFEARFFSVQMDADGALLDADIGQIAAVDSESVEVYARHAFGQARDRGFADDYRYLRYDDGDSIRILFLDCGRMLAGFRSVLLTSLLVSLAGLAAVLALMLLLSGRIVRPVLTSYEKQKRFITDAGHELRTPLTIIDADAELLEMEQGASSWLDDIRAQTRRLTALTGDLVMLSRMEEADSLQRIDFPLSDLVAETAASFQSLARTQNRRMELSIQPMLTLCGDEKSIRQLVTLLLDNAVKYSPEGGSISLRLEGQGRYIVLMVKNSAESVSSETVKNMFERFYRGDPSRNSSVRGYGVGLSIARAITDAHKGRIQAESTGQNLTITVTLPRK